MEWAVRWKWVRRKWRVALTAAVNNDHPSLIIIATAAAAAAAAAGGQCTFTAACTQLMTTGLDAPVSSPAD